MSEQPKEQARPRRKRQEPWLPAAYDMADVAAIKALAAGNANAEQQRRALDFIVYRVAATYDEPFHPGGHEGDRLTAYAAGRAFVGRTLVKMTKLTTPSRLTTA